MDLRCLVVNKFFEKYFNRLGRKYTIKIYQDIFQGKNDVCLNEAKGVVVIDVSIWINV